MKRATSIGAVFLIVLTGVMVVALLLPLSLPRAKAQAVPCAEFADKAKMWLDQTEDYLKRGGRENISAAAATAATSTAYSTYAISKGCGK